MDDNNELYISVYELTKNSRLTVPFLFKPYVSGMKNIDKNLWCASVEGSMGEPIKFDGYGKTQEEALINLKKKLLEGRE